MSLTTFSWEPNYTYTLINKHRVLTSEMDNGEKKWYYKGNRPRKWKLTFTRSYTEINEIYDFWNDRKGPYEAFYITLPNGVTGADETVTVHFVGEEIEVGFQGEHVGTISLTIEEVL